MPDGNKVKTIRIGSLQLCCETELILRYYNKIGLNKKRWFFSVFETELNDLEKLKINLARQEQTTIIYTISRDNLLKSNLGWKFFMKICFS